MRLADHFVLTLAILALFSSAPAVAQSGPRAFAAAQAPEAAVETCRASTAGKAIDCAMAKCQKKAGRGACISLTACSPSGWSGAMGVRLEELHFSDIVCGAPTKEALIAALKAYCQGHLPQMQECFVDEVTSPEGKSEKVEQGWTRATFGK
jgi:hypothetical protein